MTDMGQAARVPPRATSQLGLSSRRYITSRFIHGNNERRPWRVDEAPSADHAVYEPRPSDAVRLSASPDESIMEGESDD